MNRYEVHVQKSLDAPVVRIVVEASSWESAGRKAEVANPIVTGVRRVSCSCDWACTCS